MDAIENRVVIGAKCSEGFQLCLNRELCSYSDRGSERHVVERGVKCEEELRTQRLGEEGMVCFDQYMKRKRIHGGSGSVYEA